MSKRRVLLSGLAIAALMLAAGAGWMISLPSASATASPPPIAAQEIDATVAALKPPKRQRPLIAVIGINDATETTDYLVPYGILKRADVADVVLLATAPGPVSLYPALKVEPHSTVGQFDATYPEGADYVIVPAMSRDDDPAALQWIRSQAAKGAVVIGVCAGAKVVGAAGLLNGKRATTHWYYLKDLRERHPSFRYVADRRFVIDQGVATTTGITASMPMMLTLIESIAGRTKAEEVARSLGLAYWDARHHSAAFTFTRPFAMTALGNTLAFWNHEQFAIPLAPGLDEVSLALVADAWSRTYRSRALTFAPGPQAIETRNGIRIIPDDVAEHSSRPLLRLVEDRPMGQLTRTLAEIAVRYGRRTGDLVAMQLEHHGPQAAQ